MSRSLPVLKVLLWIVAISHLIIGGSVFISEGAQRFWAGAYGADVDWNGQMHYVVRILGVFMVGIGAAGIAAAVQPWRYRAVTIAIAVVLLLRVGQRVVLMGTAADVFGVSAGRNLVAAALFAVVAVALLVLTWASGEQAAHLDGVRND